MGASNNDHAGERMNKSLRALNRFGLGARVGEAEKIQDPRGWLKQQLRPKAARLEKSSIPTFEQITALLHETQRAQRQRDREAQQLARRRSRELFEKESVAALEQRLTSSSPFLERLISFWSNHLCVSIQGKQALLPLAGHYERSVIRPHVLGRFSDMLLASAKHPAMLLYLDNARSIGPKSLAARRAGRRGRQRGLNENYARELLELHTVGVNGGYQQKDVEQLAMILTGWTVAGFGRASRQSGAPRFEFSPMLHEPGAKTVMGTRYPEAGVSQGEKAILDLCGKESTSNYLATQLVRHFVADDPPREAVQTISLVFSSSGGDLLQVSRAVVDLAQAWDPRQRKFRRPQDWFIASLRALGATRINGRLAQVLRSLRQPMWAPPSPKGFGDTLREWGDPDSLMNRAELARTLARRIPPPLFCSLQAAGDDAAGKSGPHH